MLNIENIICEFADSQNIPYGKAEGLILGKLRIACRKAGRDLEETLRSIETLDPTKVTEFAECISTGKPPLQFLSKNSVAKSTNKDYKEIKQSNNGGPKMTTKEKLAQLNNLRTAAGMKPLKAWKESAAKLDAAIAKLSSAAPAKEDPAVPQTPEQKKVNKKLRDGMKPKADPTNVTIKQLCGDLNINAKVARAKLRRLAAKGDVLPKPVSDGRWEWEAKHKETLVKLLG